MPEHRCPRNFEVKEAKSEVPVATPSLRYPEQHASLLDLWKNKMVAGTDLTKPANGSSKSKAVITPVTHNAGMFMNSHISLRMYIANFPVSSSTYRSP